MRDMSNLNNNTINPVNNPRVSKERWLVEVVAYDCFAGGTKHTSYYFQTAIEAWKFYKAERRYDYDYGDAYTTTRRPWLIQRADKYVLPKQREHARSLKEWQKQEAIIKEDYYEQLEGDDLTVVVDVVSTVNFDDLYPCFDNDAVLF